MENNNKVSYKLTEDKTGFIIIINTTKCLLTEKALIRIKNSIMEMEDLESCELKGIEVDYITEKQQLLLDYEEATKIFVKDSIKYIKVLSTPTGGVETIEYRGEGLEDKIKYDLETYDDFLVHKNNSKIKITNYSFGSGEFID